MTKNPYRIFIVGGSGSGKTNALLNLINHEPNIGTTHLHAKNSMKKNINYKLTNEKVQA